MSLVNHLAAFLGEKRTRLTRWVLAHRIRARHPSLHCDPTAIWDYGYHDIDAITIGEGVSVLPYAEILVRSRGGRTSVAGQLVLGDHSIIATGVNIRAAGGAICIGADSGIGQHTVVVAANHTVLPGMIYLKSDWDETRTGVEVGRNVWVSAHCVLLPGSRIGDNAVIAAGSVVRGEVPPNELWGGVPARKIRGV